PAPKPDARPKPDVRPRAEAPVSRADGEEVAWLAALRASNTAAMQAVQVPPQPEKTPTENSAAPRSETPAESGSDEADPENPGRHRSGDKAVSVSELLARHRDDD
ncbi:hypothetical protein HMPREF0724_14617, partial [Prescottella equi ATCC 33707]